jgi:hypothetical protein
MINFFRKIKLSTFSDVAQIISALAVVISLIYIGAQINQNTKATQSAMRQSIADNDITYLMSSLDNSILAIASYKIEKNIELSDLEMSQLISRQHVNFRVFENAFYQFEQELLELETWIRYRFIIKDLLKNDLSAKKMWMSFDKSFTNSFQNEVSQILNNNRITVSERNIILEDSINKIN